MRLDELTAFLDETLRVDAFEDASHNGLQVGAGEREVKKVCVAVDGSLEGIAEAARRGADLLMCHHGISWGDSLARITGLNYRRMVALVESGLALYACHLPLDAHAEYGNNVRICRALGLRRLKPFGMYHGKAIGFEGTLPKAIDLPDFVALVSRVIGPPAQVMPFGKERVRRVGVVSGGAGGNTAEAGEKGLDVFLSGEPTLAAYHAAKEHAINAVFAGHYATERFGVQAVGDLLEERCGLDVEFIDFAIPV